MRKHIEKILHGVKRLFQPTGEEKPKPSYAQVGTAGRHKKEEWQPGTKAEAIKVQSQKPEGKIVERRPKTEGSRQRPSRGPRPQQRPESRRHRVDASGSRAELRYAPSTISHPPSSVLQPPSAPWDPASFQVPPEAGKKRFQDFELVPEILHAIADLNFRYCTPIQAEILPHTLAGRDAAGQAQTGTGKTAAFLLTIMQYALTHPLPARKPGTPRALVLAPTRELVMQIQKDAQSLGRYAGFTSVAVFGGMDYEKQKRQMYGQNVDLIAATPGRLIDFLRGHVVDLSQVETLVLDEADRMLDMGFIPDVRRIIHHTPPKERRQTLLFSATLSKEVMRLASQWMRDFVKIDIEPEHRAVDTVEQKVYVLTRREKFALLMHLLRSLQAERVLIFRNRRDATTRLYQRLTREGIRCAELSGDVPQEKRVRILEDFRSGKIRVVVATDVAGRGIHVANISHVVNYDIPEQPEDFVHRIGRTGRAGVSGEAITFADEESGFLLPAIEEYIGRPLTYIHPDESLLKPPPRSHAHPPPPPTTA